MNPSCGGCVELLTSEEKPFWGGLFFDNLAAVEVAIHKQRRREERKFVASLFLAISA
jgi:hypothetical protein